MDLRNLYFQQDFAICHPSDETIGLLHEKFSGRIISQNLDINWPPQPCDLTPVDFFLWGCVKGIVYAKGVGKSGGLGG